MGKQKGKVLSLRLLDTPSMTQSFKVNAVARGRTIIHKPLLEPLNLIESLKKNISDFESVFSQLRYLNSENRNSTYKK